MLILYMMLHEIISIEDENGVDELADLLDDFLNKSTTEEPYLIHYTFLLKLFDLLSTVNLETLVNQDQEITIDIHGFPRTKRYRIVKPLKKIPIYELRYGISRDEHLRMLFFPITYKETSFYVFSKAFIKHRTIQCDPTDQNRDLMYNLYIKVKTNPGTYLEEAE